MKRKTEERIEAVWCWIAPVIFGFVVMAGPPLLLTGLFWAYGVFYEWVY
jgi:hypothetical protein